ncbi:hypothetical protein ACFY4I_02890 [Streptomyces scabiei]
MGGRPLVPPPQRGIVLRRRAHLRLFLWRRVLLRWWRWLRRRKLTAA